MVEEFQVRSRLDLCVSCNKDRTSTSRTIKHEGANIYCNKHTHQQVQSMQREMLSSRDTMIWGRQLHQHSPITFQNPIVFPIFLAIFEYSHQNVTGWNLPKTSFQQKHHPPRWISRIQFEMTHFSSAAFLKKSTSLQGGFVFLPVKNNLTYRGEVSPVKPIHFRPFYRWPHNFIYNDRRLGAGPP